MWAIEAARQEIVTSVDYLTQRSENRVTKAILLLLHCGVFTWGALVVREHVRSNAHATKDDGLLGCELKFHTWGATRNPCARLRFNCNARGRLLSGSSDESDHVLELIERSALRHVAFSHCPALEIPSSLVLEFPNLNAIAMFNFTIVRWDAIAALTRTYSPTMAQLQLIDTNLSSIPDGLLHSALPQGLNLVLYRLKLNALPDTIVLGLHRMVHAVA